MPGPENLANVPLHNLTCLRDMLEDGTPSRAAEQWLKARGYPSSKSSILRWKARGYLIHESRKHPKQLELDLTTDYFDPAFDLEQRYMKWFYGQVEHFTQHPEILARWLQDIGYAIDTAQFIEWMRRQTETNGATP